MNVIESAGVACDARSLLIQRTWAYEQESSKINFEVISDATRKLLPFTPA
jgi:hypothetical protein